MEALEKLEKKASELIEKFERLNKEAEMTIIMIGQEQKENQYKN